MEELFHFLSRTMSDFDLPDRSHPLPNSPGEQFPPQESTFSHDPSSRSLAESQQCYSKTIGNYLEQTDPSPFNLVRVDQLDVGHPTAIRPAEMAVSNSGSNSYPLGYQYQRPATTATFDTEGTGSMTFPSSLDNSLEGNDHPHTHQRNSDEYSSHWDSINGCPGPEASMGNQYVSPADVESNEHLLQDLMGQPYPVFASAHSFPGFVVEDDLDLNEGTTGAEPLALVNSHQPQNPPQPQNHARVRRPQYPASQTARRYKHPENRHLGRKSHISGSYRRPVSRTRRVRRGNPEKLWCIFFFDGCSSKFAAKNEWKRHINTLHIQTHIWKCDLPKCEDRLESTYIRKDHFKTHIQRMHKLDSGTPSQQQQQSPMRQSPPQPGLAPGELVKIEFPIIEARCKKFVRDPPARSRCGFCPNIFEGPGNWDTMLEHVYSHHESSEPENVAPEKWQIDDELIQWMMDE